MTACDFALNPRLTDTPYTWSDKSEVTPELACLEMTLQGCASFHRAVGDITYLQCAGTNGSCPTTTALFMRRLTSFRNLAYMNIRLTLRLIACFASAWADAMVKME